MFDDRLGRLEQLLRIDPGDLDAWRRLARLVARTARVPDFVEARRHGPQLLRLWAASPHDRHLHGLVLGGLGLELVSHPQGPAGADWEDMDADGGDHRYDPLTGLPLRVRLAGGGPELVLIPGGVVTATDRRAWESGGVPRRVEVETFWMGRELLRRGPGAAPATGADPLAALTWGQAAALAARWGARLPREVEWLRAALAGRPPPVTAREQRDLLQPVSPLGMEGAAGPLREWSADAGPPQVDRWLGREPPEAAATRPRVCLGPGPHLPRGRSPRDWHYSLEAPGARHPDLGLRLARDLVP